MHLLERLSAVGIAWGIAFVVMIAAGTVLRAFDRSSSDDQTMIAQMSQEGRSVWCLYASRSALEGSRWNPATGPIPLSADSAKQIAADDIDRMTAGRTDLQVRAPELKTIGMGRHPERGDTYYYEVRFSTSPSSRDTETAGVVFVLLDGSTIRSRSTGCPAPRSHPEEGSSNGVDGGMVLVAASLMFELVAVVYSPLAIFLGPRIRRGVIVVVGIVGLLAAIAGMSRAWLGLDYPLFDFPPGVEFGLLLGAFPATLMIELVVRIIIPSGDERHAT